MAWLGMAWPGVTWLALCRGLHVASMLSAFGTLLLAAAVVRPALDAWPGAAALRLRLRWLIGASLALALASGIVWLLGTAASIADAETFGETLAALPLVVAQTRFGHLLAARLGLLAAALALLLGRSTPIRWAQGGALVGAIALQPLLGHAGAMGGGAGVALSATEMLHLLAAGAWLGGLLPLALCIAALPPPRAAIAAERFLPVGLASVLVLAGSGAVQGAALIGSIDGLLHTPYGRWALLKLAVFAALFGLACLNRFGLTARLRQAGSGSGPGAEAARWRLCVSVAVETALGLCVVLAAAALGSTEPAIDAPAT